MAIPPVCDSDYEALEEIYGIAHGQILAARNAVA